jgi:DNA-3-methyladenine glycosylase
MSERNLEKLRRRFFNRKTEIVAKDLIGKYLVRETDKGKLVGKVIEVEAYLGPEDKASHSYNYRKTERTKTMFDKPGTWYVYLIYGMYHCLNIITEEEGMPSAVLFRELYPIEGIDLMKESRDVKIGKNYKNLLDGPGKLSMGLNITKEKFNGRDSCSSNSKLYLTHGEKINRENIEAYERIGIDYAEEDKHLKLRFRLKI